MGPIEGSTPDLRALHEWEGSENTWKPRGPAPLVWLRIGRDTTADIAGIPYKTIYVGVHGGGTRTAPCRGALYNMAWELQISSTLVRRKMEFLELTSAHPRNTPMTCPSGPASARIMNPY